MTENMENIIKIITENTEISDKLQIIEDKESVYKFFKELNPNLTLKEFEEGIEEMFSNYLKELENEDLLNISGGGGMKQKVLNKTIAGALAAISIGSALPSNTNAYNEPYQEPNDIVISIAKKLLNPCDRKYLIGLGAAILATIGIPTTVAIGLGIKKYCDSKQNNTTTTTTDNNTKDNNNNTETNDNKNNKPSKIKKNPVPPFPSEFTGIRNIGNSCYFNSALQLLYQIPEVREGKFYTLNDLKKQLEESKIKLEKKKDDAENARNNFIINDFLSGTLKEDYLAQAIRKLPSLESYKEEIKELVQKRNAEKSGSEIRFKLSNKIARKCTTMHFKELCSNSFSENEKIGIARRLIGNNISRSKYILNEVADILFGENNDNKDHFRKSFMDIYDEYNHLDLTCTNAEDDYNEVVENINALSEKNPNEIQIEPDARSKDLIEIMSNIAQRKSPIDIINKILKDKNPNRKAQDTADVIESYFKISETLVSIEHLPPDTSIDKELLEKIPSKYKIIETNRYDFLASQKVAPAMNIPEIIDDVRGQKYELASVVIHSGNKKGGHYYAYSKSTNGNWYQINDDKITRKGSYDEIKNDVSEKSRLVLYRPVVNK